MADPGPPTLPLPLPLHPTSHGSSWPSPPAGGNGASQSLLAPFNYPLQSSRVDSLDTHFSHDIIHPLCVASSSPAMIRAGRKGFNPIEFAWAETSRAGSGWQRLSAMVRDGLHIGFLALTCFSIEAYLSFAGVGLRYASWRMRSCREMRTCAQCYHARCCLFVPVLDNVPPQLTSKVVKGRGVFTTAVSDDRYR